MTEYEYEYYSESIQTPLNGDLSRVSHIHVLLRPTSLLLNAQCSIKSMHNVHLVHTDKQCVTVQYHQICALHCFVQISPVGWTEPGLICKGRGSCRPGNFQRWRSCSHHHKVMCCCDCDNDDDDLLMMIRNWSENPGNLVLSKWGIPDPGGHHP